MNTRIATRMNRIQKSFIREILKITADPEIISFAGGLPHPISFPVQSIENATTKVLHEDGTNALQYSTTEGYLPLRKYIVERYRKSGLVVNPDSILITTGSQQALDLLGKVLINQGDQILIEKPGYLGAIQAFSLYEPDFHTVPIHNEGVNLEEFGKQINQVNPKLFYCVPNFQNPTGITYTKENRVELSNILKDRETYVIEDNPYGELRFMGEDVPHIKTLLGDQAILLGSFSKVVSPAMRLGWICCTDQSVMDNLLIAKQCSDLHTNYFSQRVLYQYLSDHDLDTHIEKIKSLYKTQRECMIASIHEHFPEEVKITQPEGGMFIWAELPTGYSALELFNRVIEEKVAFVPGDPFYVHETNVNTFRLNYTNSNEDTIKEGIKRMGIAINAFLKEK